MFSRQHGFSMIESLVAMLVALTIVASVGILGMRLTHRRSSSASISAATSIAEKAIEAARPASVPGSVVAMPNGLVDETGTISVGGPYQRSTAVTTGPEMVSGGTTKSLSKVTVLVTHVSNPEVRVQLETYYRVTN